jgi:hypothetical protein
VYIHKNVTALHSPPRSILYHYEKNKDEKKVAFLLSAIKNFQKKKKLVYSRQNHDRKKVQNELKLKQAQLNHPLFSFWRIPSNNLPRA